MLARADAGAVSCQIVDYSLLATWKLAETGVGGIVFLPWKPTLLGDPAIPTALRIWEWPWANEARAARDRILMETIVTDDAGYKVMKDKEKQANIISKPPKRTRRTGPVEN